LIGLEIDFNYFVNSKYIFKIVRYINILLEK